MKRVLYSPGFGAGWLSWSCGISVEQREFMAHHPRLIEAVDAGWRGDLSYEYRIDYDDGSKFENAVHGLSQAAVDALGAFVDEWRERWDGESLPYLGGADNLATATVSGPYRVEDYDGNETVVEPGDGEWW